MKNSMLLFIISSLILSILLPPQIIGANFETLPSIEILDIQTGKVTKAINTKEIQSEAINCLKSITKLYVKVSPIPKIGKGIKIPLQPPIPLNNQWIKGDLIDQVIIFYETGAQPIMMVFNDENKAFFFEFNCNLSNLLNKIEIVPKD